MKLSTLEVYTSPAIFLVFVFFAKTSGQPNSSATSAHSLWHGKRFYYDTDWSLKSEGEIDIEEERIMLGLRLKCGIDKSLIKKDFSRFVKMGLMKESENKIALTSEGMLVSNLIISELL